MPEDPEIERIVRESVIRFEAYLGMWVSLARSSGWLAEYEKEVRRVALEARKQK